MFRLWLEVGANRASQGSDIALPTQDSCFLRYLWHLYHNFTLQQPPCTLCQGLLKTFHLWRNEVMIVGYICSIAAVCNTPLALTPEALLLIDFVKKWLHYMLLKVTVHCPVHWGLIQQFKGISLSVPVQLWQSSVCSASEYSQRFELNSELVSVWECMLQCLALGLYPHTCQWFTLPFLPVLEFQLMSPFHLKTTTERKNNNNKKKSIL